VKYKIVSIIGARPQFIKTPLISREIRKFAKEILVHTGQHYDGNMSDIFFSELKIFKPDYNLAVGSDIQGKQTAKMLEKIEEVLLKEKPDLVIIYGDTNSTVAGALAAVKLHIPVAHIEAGMRSYNREMPEEINRVVSDHIAELLFAPTLSSVKILKGEGVTKGVYFVGDVMYDIRKKIKNQKSLPRAESRGEIRKIMKKYTIEPKKYLLATVHRQENTDIRQNLENIIEAFIKIGHSERSEESLANARSLTSEEILRLTPQDDNTIVFPAHPRTVKFLKGYGLDKKIAKHPHIKLIEPVGFMEMMALTTNARLILTDSGGVQKEAYLDRVPCITLRKETEWIETVASGWNRLADTDVKKIVRLSKDLSSANWQTKNHPNFLGNGQAYLKITKVIKKHLDSL